MCSSDLGLVDGLGELADHRQVGHDNADGDRAHAGESDIGDPQLDEQAADHGDQDVEQVAHIAHHRAEDIAVPVGPLRIGEEPLVERGEVGLRGLLVVEDLDDLLPAHDLLDEALLGGERVLLGDHVPRGRAAQPAGDLDHDGDHDDDEDRQPQAVVEHHGEHGAQGQPGLDERGHRLADEL